MKYSTIKYRETVSNGDFRLDSEYYHPSYIKLEYTLSKLDCSLFGEFTDSITCGPFGSTLLCQTYLTNGVVVARPFNIVDLTLESDNLVYISRQDFKFKKLKSFKEGDILFSRVGDVRCGILQNNFEITISPNIIAVKVNSSKINPYYAIVFFNTIYGLPQISRGLKVVAQPTIQTNLISNLKIVLLSKHFQNYIENIVKLSFELRNTSEKFYRDAELHVEDELSLTNWEPKQKLTFIKNYSDTKNGLRTDAEFFQPFYEEIERKIKSVNYDKLDNIINIKKCIEPGSDVYQDNGILFLRVSNISKFGIKEGNAQFISNDLYKLLISHQPKRGEILLSKDATPGIAYYLTDEPEKMIPSGGILRLKIKDESEILPEYLTLVLNSLVVQKQIERDAGGSIINHWLVDQVKNTLIPILSQSSQKKISEIINESFKFRKKSAKFLYLAKKAVEMAIEQSEEKAIKFINENLDEEKSS